MIIPKCGEKKCDEIIQQINQQQNIKKETDPYVDIAMGAAVRKSMTQMEEYVIGKADQTMYEDKNKRKQEDGAWK